MPIQLIPAIKPPSATPKTSNQGGSPAKPGLVGKRFTVSKKLPEKAKAGSSTRATNPKTRVPMGRWVVPALSPTPGIAAKASSPLKGPVPHRGMPEQTAPLTTATRSGAGPLDQKPVSPPIPELHPAPRASALPVQAPKVAIINTQRVHNPRTSTMPGKPGVTLKLGNAPTPSPGSPTSVSNPATVVIPAATPASTVRTESLAAPSALPPPTTETVAKLPSLPRGWRIQPTTVRHQVGAIATRWKVSPPGRIRHTMEITVSNRGSNWQVEVKAHHQDGAWLSGALANTTALNQGFSQHGWDLSQVSLWLGQPSSGGNAGQYFGQPGHAPPESHYGGYGSSGTRSESRSTQGPQTGINYTA